jgi:hypothetical protein
MYVSKSITSPAPHIGHSRHGLFCSRLVCQSNAKPSEKDHDLIGTNDAGSCNEFTDEFVGKCI